MSSSCGPARLEVLAAPGGNHRLRDRQVFGAESRPRRRRRPAAGTAAPACMKSRRSMAVSVESLSLLNHTGRCAGATTLRRLPVPGPCLYSIARPDPGRITLAHDSRRTDPGVPQPRLVDGQAHHRPLRRGRAFGALTAGRARSAESRRARRRHAAAPDVSRTSRPRRRLRAAPAANSAWCATTSWSRNCRTSRSIPRCTSLPCDSASSSARCRCSSAATNSSRSSI